MQALAGASGGAWGGVVVGLVEAGLVAATAGPADEYWLVPFAVVSYGAVGALIGVAVGVVAAVATGAGGRARANTAALASAAAAVLLGTFVVRYHVVQRVFHEELVNASAGGLGVNLGVLAGCVVGGALIGLAVRAAVDRPYGLVGAVMGLAATLALAAGGAAATASTASDAPVARRTSGRAAGAPNIVLVIADTLRADTVARFVAANADGGLHALTADALTFSHAYVQSSWTRPSIATILTGLYPSQHGAVHKMSPLSDAVTTLAEALRARGYWTAGFVTNINVAPIFNFQQGFDEFTYLAPSFYFGAADSATRLAIYKGLRLVRERLLRNRIYVENYYQDAAVVDAAVTDWLAQRPPQPFFLLVHYMDPHDPYFEIPYNGHGVARVTDPDPAPARRDELHGLYAENVAYFDGFLKQLLAQLKARGDYDNTLVVFVADHGEEFQEHGGWWHGTTLFEEAVHVPLMIKRPGEPRAGQTEGALVRTLDLAPTMLAAAGAAALPASPGRDLFAPAPAAPPLLAEESLEGNVLASLRSGGWKLITANPDNPRGLPPVALYDLDSDPGETRNRAADEPARVQAMRAELERLLTGIRGPQG